ncbi:cyclic GMP-AMP synthase [Amphiprion ocellaris]|uniref:Mab-21-like nucleotidyltransferase domain-containing protein n=1 Tax=Amphiprion ocellaris TaxID=80972 RepID=A0A3Q1CA53_AMPOC|nr:cyclic GMP-AMP synthase [Amphiprion ocellaris]XP_023118980.2 cyclic GMP-AMP synthase [Amphiprion ocellaris]XP_023118981.2 cyclic GMP-AMP synthase [Amphiprion ocellaris]
MVVQDGLTPRKDETRGKSSPPRLTPARQRQKVKQQPSEESSLVVEQSVSISPELASLIKRKAKDLKIRQTDRRWAAEVVNDFRENLLRFLRSCTDQPLFQSADFLTTGSYFEKVKIHSPDEFDMMLKLQVPNRLTMTELDGGLFYRIDLIRTTRTHIQAFLLENQRTLSSSKVLNETYRLVRKFLKNYKVPDECCRWEVNRKNPYCPAVTLSLCRTDKNSDELISVDVVPSLEVQGWPVPVRNGPDVENWLGKKVRQEIRGLPCYFVPKRLKGRNLSEDAKESWRISFSHIEKKMITSHGNKKTCCESNATKCCRKQCLKLLKSLIEGLKQRFPKELEDLCSYHGKTVFLHTLSSRFEDSMWACELLPSCFLQLVSALEDHARRGVLPHFFVPECNLFSPAIFPRRALAFLVNALEEQQREGLPLLKHPLPVARLRPETISAEVFTEDDDQSAAVSSAVMTQLVLLFAMVLFGLSFLIQSM